MTGIAILGFGVVGSGVAGLIKDNYSRVAALGGDGVEIKYILDLRDFPDSPFADKIVHDYNVILNDPSVATVIEVMGGSHPAYEFTVSALKAGKNVITSNKEVVAAFGDEFLRLAKEHGVCYRFEASVGGGIPVISPMISILSHNEISEVRGILNGTTNYILTKMFTYGESFNTALQDAQAKGYAEKEPSVDVDGIDSARKISILGAIASGKLIDTDCIHTEGITAIRSRDVKAAESVGCTIKLVGRCILKGDAPYIYVAPHLVPSDMPLSGVSGVYNAVEVIGSPLGNVVFYGQGAGAGATASAVVGDLCLIMQSGRNAAFPEFCKSSSISPLDSLRCQRYISVRAGSRDAAIKAFGEVRIISDDEELSFITDCMTESEARNCLLGIDVMANIRLLD